MSLGRVALPENYFDWDEAKRKAWIKRVVLPSIRNLREKGTEEGR
jgi:hypothetical protein